MCVCEGLTEGGVCVWVGRCSRVGGERIREGGALDSELEIGILIFGD